MLELCYLVNSIFLRSKPKKFWSFVKSCAGNFSIPSCVQYGGHSAFTPKAKADIFNKFFHSLLPQRSGDLDLRSLQLSLRAWLMT